MEGKEVRFGIAASSLFATVTTDSSSGAVNAMHDSFMPLSGGLLMANMMVDEVIVGGVGSGLFGMLLFCIVTVFLGGLMVGRTPEYVGKKIQADEVKMTMLALLCVPGTILLLTSVASINCARSCGDRQSRALTASRKFFTPTPPPRRPTAAPLPASMPTRPSII